MANITMTVEAVAFDIRMSRKEAAALAELICRHGNDAELNRFGRVLRELLEPREDYTDTLDRLS